MRKWRRLSFLGVQCWTGRMVGGFTVPGSGSRDDKSGEEGRGGARRGEEGRGGSRRVEEGRGGEVVPIQVASRSSYGESALLFRVITMIIPRSRPIYAPG
jgi:hypothetical protein